MLTGVNCCGIRLVESDLRDQLQQRQRSAGPGRAGGRAGRMGRGRGVGRPLEELTLTTDLKKTNERNKRIYKKQPTHSAYRSGKVVKEYKKQFTKKYGKRKSPYKGTKTKKRGLTRWFDEKWVNQRGEIGYKNKNDIYRPTHIITKKTD